MMRKKLVSIGLAGTLAAGMLSGSALAASTEGASETASTGESVTLAVWNEPNKDDALNMYKQCEKATGIQVDVTVIPESDYSSKLNQMVATKDSSTDIYVVWETDIKNFAETGGIINLDDDLKDSSINTGDMIDAVSKLTEGLGGTYGLPWCAAAEVMYYNKDMFDAAGIDYPTNDWSYEDFKAAAEKLTQKNEDGTTAVYGMDLPNTQTWWAGIGGAGDQVYDPESGKLVIGDGAVSFVSDCAKMVKDGIMPEPSSDTSDLFGAGKAAMSWQGTWMIGSYKDTLGFNWDIATIPTNKVKYNTLHTGFYTINANSEKQDAAFKVIEYLMGEEGQTINSKASGNMSAIKSIAAEGAWKVDGAPVENWDAVTDALESGVFGYTCLPSGVTSNAVSEFDNALLGQESPEDAVKNASDYAAETIGY
jgi:multiple sugar transport system substrate-binding protein